MLGLINTYMSLPSYLDQMASKAFRRLTIDRSLMAIIVLLLVVSIILSLLITFSHPTLLQSMGDHRIKASLDSTNCHQSYSDQINELQKKMDVVLGKIDAIKTDSSRLDTEIEKPVRKTDRGKVINLCYSIIVKPLMQKMHGQHNPTLILLRYIISRWSIVQNLGANLLQYTIYITMINYE